jgi:hypothetical protein
MRWQPPVGWEGRTNEKVRVEVDVADLVSERKNRYTFDQPSNGWTDMRVLPDPTDAAHDLFDGGRRIAVGKRESFEARGLVIGKPIHLVVRVAQESKAIVRVRVDGRDAGPLELERVGGWEEKAISIGEGFVTNDHLRIELTNEGPGDFVDYHAWITQ